MEAIESALPNPRQTQVPGTLHRASWVSVRPLSGRGRHEVLTMGDDLNVPPDKENLESHPRHLVYLLTPQRGRLVSASWQLETRATSDSQIIFTWPTRLKLVSGDATQRLVYLCVRNSAPLTGPIMISHRMTKGATETPPPVVPAQVGCSPLTESSVLAPTENIASLFLRRPFAAGWLSLAL